MAITMKAVAEAAGVSAATVSKVLNGADRYISDATRKKILFYIDKMGYIPNSAARSLKTNCSKTIGFILPDIVNPFFPEIVRGIEDTARKYSYALVICNTDNDFASEKNALHFLNSKMVDGIIFTRGIKKIDPTELNNVGVPVVIVDRSLDGSWPKLGQVFINANSAFEKSTNVLIEKGCRKIAFISAKYPSTKNKRLIGYKNALKKANIDYLNSLVYLENYDVNTGKLGMNTLLANNDQIDGVVCGDDLIAFGVLETLHKKRLNVPKDIKIMGFDDIYFSQFTTPALSTIHQPAYEMGSEATKMLIEHLIKNTPMSKKQLEYSVLLRETT